MTSRELYAKERALKAEIVETIKALLGKKTFTLDEPVEDDSNNLMLSIDREQVHCENTVYCITDLSIDDGMYLVSLIEI
jgi:hypothetical protein